MMISGDKIRPEQARVEVIIIIHRSNLFRARFGTKERSDWPLTIAFVGARPHPVRDAWLTA